MTYHIAICDDDSRDAGYVSELLHQWAQLRGCAVTEEPLSLGGRLPVPL